MPWQVEIPLITRVWINDLDETSPTYSEDRILQVVAVAAQNVIREVSLSTIYAVDVVNLRIQPDPTSTELKDNDFVALVALKAACILDQSTFRTKAINEGIRTSLGSASLNISGNLKGYQTLLEMGPCAMYSQLRTEFDMGNPNIVQAVLSPFIGNDFDPKNISSYYGGNYRTNSINPFYS
jgi:hypothetical protein